jgi:hypothetical protein
MKYIYSVLLLLSSILLTGCATTSYYADYQIFLSQVERPLKAAQAYGDPKIIDLTDDPKYKFCFEDSLLKISWFTDSKQILFSLENVSNHTIKIPWDEAAYADCGGFSHRVIHSSIDYNDKEKPQPPSVIIRQCLLEDSIIPTDLIKWFDTGGEHPVSGWTVASLFPDFVSNKGSKDDIYSTLVNFASGIKVFMGKEFQILLPLTVQGTTYEYIFTFRIGDIKVNKK